MNAYIFSLTINYIIAIIALIIAVKTNRKVNDHYEHDHINNENESI